MKYKKYVRPLFCYVLGFFILALGSSVSIKSNLGVTPVNSIPYAISLVTGSDMGAWVTGIFSFFVFLQFLLLRRQFRAVMLLQVPASFLFGYFVDVTNMIAGLFPAPGSYFMQIILALFSILLIALGVFLYLEAGLVSLPAEGIIQAISARTGRSLPTCKLFWDCFLVLCSAAISLIGLGALRSVREGTVLAAVLVSRVLAVLMKHFSAPLRRLIFPARQEEAPSACSGAAEQEA